jgi:hypothetical protein
MTVEIRDKLIALLAQVGVTDGESSQTDSEAKRAWDAGAKHLKTVR